MPFGLDLPSLDDLNPFDEDDEDETPAERRRRKRRQRIAAGLQDAPPRPLPPRDRDYDVPIPASKREDVKKETKKAKLARAKAAAAAKRAEADRDPGWKDYLHGAATESRGFFPMLAQVGTETGTAGYKDIRRVVADLRGDEDPFPYALRRSPKTGKLIIARDKEGKPIPSAGHLAEYLFGTADVAATETLRTAKDIGLVAAGTPLTIKTLEQFDKKYADWLETKATQAEKRIAQAPISTAATFVWGAGAASKLATVPKMAANMQRLNPGLTKAAARAAAAAEHRNPGVAKTLGIEGGMPPRLIRGMGPTSGRVPKQVEQPLAVGKPWSRTPGGRMGQTLYDEITTYIDSINPNLPFASGLRAQTAIRRRKAQDRRRYEAGNARLLEDVGDVVEGTSKLSKARSVIGMSRPIRHRAEALIAALEGPQDATIRESVEARIASLEDTISKSDELVPEANRIKVLRAKLKRAGDPEARAEIADELKKIVAELDFKLGKGVEPVSGSPERRAAIRAWAAHFGKNGKPTRASRRYAQGLIVVADHIARSQNPADPKAWYRQNLAEVTSEKAEAFLARADPLAAQYQTGPGRRLGLTTPRAGVRKLEPKEALTLLNRADRSPGYGGLVLFSRGGRLYTMQKEGAGTFSVRHFRDEQGETIPVAEQMEVVVPAKEARGLLREAEASTFSADPASNVESMIGQFTRLDDSETPVFYSHLQQQVQELPGQQMVAQSLRKKLKENMGVSDVEWSAMGMDHFFMQYKPTQRIPYSELNKYLADPLNAYNLDEIVYSAGHGAKDGPRGEFGARYGGTTDHGWALVHKEPAPGEVYYELVMTLPTRAADVGGDYASGHWDGIVNPIVHLRFIVGTDTTGKKALILDEVQSDWATAQRKFDKKQKERATQGLPSEPTTRDVPEGETPRDAEARRQAAVDRRSQFQKDNPELMELGDLGYDLEDMRANLRDAERDRNYLANESHTPDDMAEMDAEVNDLQRAIAHKEGLRDELDARIPQSLKDEYEIILNEAMDAIMATGNLRARHVIWDLDQTHLDAAVRRVMRWAHDSDTDRIIVMPGEVHAYRYMRVLETPSGKQLPDPSMGPDEFDDYIRGAEEFRGMDTDAMRLFVRNKLRGREEIKPFFDLYEKTYPRLFEENIGHKGQWMEGIIDARYSDELASFESDLSPIGAWVIDLGPEGRHRASIPMRQMQHQPEWDELPRGARELLSDGRQAMRLFEGANVDTVIHELAHIALPDLDAESLAVLERHFGGKVDEWTSGQHEAFARGFEQYMRTGRAANVFLASAFSQIAKWMRGVWADLYGGRVDDFDLHPEVAAAYDRMLGYRGVPTVLSKTERSQVKNQIASLAKALDEPLESEEYQHALEALEVISGQIEEAGEHILTRDSSPEQAAAIREGLARRRDLVTTRMAEQGVMPGEWTPETRARGYFPQTSIWDIQGMPQAGPVRMAATGDVVGVPRLDAKTLMRRPNRLIRYSTGEVLNDPAVLVKVLRARLRYIDTLDARGDLWNRGTPIKKGQEIPKYGVALVRNPNVAAEKIRDDIHAALRLPPERFSELEMRGKMDDIDEAESLKEAAEDIIWLPGMGPKPHWAADTKNVRTVPAAVARKRLGDVFMSAPKGVPGAVLGGFNAMARLAAIYLPFGGGRYVVRNAAQNAVLLALTQPTALARIGRRHSKYKTAHPDDYNKIMAEGGTILGTALPEFNTRPQGRAQEAERYINERTQAAGSFLGKFADNPFRWASWTKHAERYGFHGPDGYHRLLNDDRYANVRETVMQRTRDDMIDFDTLSPFEKEVIARYMFLWPFIRGITKWPFMYAREYPGRVAVAGSLAQGVATEENPLDTGAMREGGLMLGRDLGWLNPAGPALENVERGVRIFRGKDEMSLSAVADMLAPQYREIIQSFSDRQGKTWKQSMANTFVPGASTYNMLNRGGSVIDQLDRFLGQSTEPPMSVVNQRKGRAAEINGYLDKIEEQGMQLPKERLEKVLVAHEAYERYKELSARAGFGLRDQGKKPSLAADGPNHRLRAAIMFAVLDEVYPGQVTFDLDDYDKLTAKQRDDFFRQVEKAMWGARTDFLRDAKEEFEK